MNAPSHNGCWRRKQILFLFAVCFFTTSAALHAATMNSQPTGGNWSDPNAWVEGVVPGPADSVIIAAAPATPLICDVNETCSNLTLNVGVQLNIADNVVLAVISTPIVNPSGSAIVTGAGTSKLLLAGTATQLMSGGGTFGNFEVSNLVSYVQAPTTADMALAPGAVLTVDSGAFLQQGNANRKLAGNAGFVLADGATLGIKDTGGIVADVNDTNGFIRVTGGRSFSSAANYFYNGTAAQSTGSGLPATVASFTMTNRAGVTLTNSLAVTGATTLRGGALMLGPGATFTPGSSLVLGRGTTLDVTNLGPAATFNLGSASLSASGTGATNTLAAAFNGGVNSTINLGSQPITLTYDGAHPALYVFQGSLALNGNAFTVNTTNDVALAAGSYVIAQLANGSIVTNGVFTVSGTAIASGMGAAIQASATNLNLLLAPMQLAITSVNGGLSPAVAAPFNVVVQVQGGGGLPVNATTDTTVVLGLASGTGILSGVTNGTILAGTSSVTISNVVYSKAEANVALNVTRVSGDALATGTSAVFSVSAGPAVTLALVSGNAQTALGLATLASPFVVTTTDAGGNAVGGTPVTFAIATVPGSATGQSLSVTSTVTAGNGQATSVLTLGNSVGAYTVTATSAGLSNSPVTFTATATANLAVTSVNGGVSPTAGSVFNVVVQVQGAGGAPVNVLNNTTVTLSRSAGSGALGGTLTALIPAGTSAVTFSNLTYTKAETGVVLTATRTSGDALNAGNSAAFTVVAGAAALLTLTSGNNQGGVVGTTLATALSVTVSDANTNPVSGASVTFAIASTPVGAAGQLLGVTNATTAANGQAVSSFTLGDQAGTYTVTATSAGLAGSPATFTATGTGKLVITSVNGGANPVAGTPFNVVVQAQGVGATPFNVAADTTVTLSRTSGTGTLGGTLTGTILAGTSSVTFSNLTYIKAESGVVLGVARTSGDTLVAGSSASFTVTAAAAATLALTSGNNQTGKTLTALTSFFVATVVDAYANPVSGVSVTFAVATVPSGATGQSLSAGATTTAANGQASSKLTLGSLAGTYTVTVTSAGLTGSPLTFSAVASSGNYLVLTAVTNEYQICLKCHSAYFWRAGTPPNGLSANGTATTPVETDQAQEFSPRNKSGHPVVTGLNNYVNSTGNKPLVASELRPPWNVNVGTQTMLCSDCHDATTTNYVASASQGPHGSANPFMLRGPNAANWPTPTSFAGSWCSNCHNDSSHSMGGHANHHSAGGCYRCHVVIPHGSAMSRLIADRDGVMPARYAYNNDKTTVYITSFTKSTGSYGESTCRTSCGNHSSGSSTSMENW